MIDKLIRRMINAGYSDEDIVNRLRCKEELVKAIRVLMTMKEKRDYDE